MRTLVDLHKFQRHGLHHAKTCQHGWLRAREQRSAGSTRNPDRRVGGGGQRHFVGDELAVALHHERQQHDMGLTIHYQLATTGTEAPSRKLVQQLRQAALDLPFQHVGEVVEFQGDQCDWKQRPNDDPYRWLLIQAGIRGVEFPRLTRHANSRQRCLLTLPTNHQQNQKCSLLATGRVTKREGYQKGHKLLPDKRLVSFSPYLDSLLSDTRQLT